MNGVRGKQKVRKAWPQEQSSVSYVFLSPFYLLPKASLLLQGRTNSTTQRSKHCTITARWIPVVLRNSPWNSLIFHVEDISLFHSEKTNLGTGPVGITLLGPGRPRAAFGQAVDLPQSSALRAFACSLHRRPVFFNCCVLNFSQLQQTRLFMTSPCIRSSVIGSFLKRNPSALCPGLLFSIYIEVTRG